MPTQQSWKLVAVCVTLTLTLTFCPVGGTGFSLTGRYSASEPIRNLASDNSGNIYVGAKGTVLVLHPDTLNVTDSASTCSSGTECTNQNLVLEVYQNGNEGLLLSCGTDKGTCERRSLKKLNNVTGSTEQIASSTIVSNVAKFVQIKSATRNKDLLYYARKYANFPSDNNKYDPIRAFDLSNWRVTDDYSLEFNDRARRNIPVMDYKAVMESVDFIYFLSNQSSSSKLSKICKNPGGEDGTMYEDIHISCIHRGRLFPFVKHGVMVKAGDGEFVLVALFTEEDMSSDPNVKGAICVFSEKNILQEFLSSRKDRFQKPCIKVTDQLYVGTVTEPTCLAENINVTSPYYEAMNNPNFCKHSLDVAFKRVVGVRSMDGNASLVVEGAPTKLAAGQSYIPTVYVATSTGIVHQYWLDDEDSYKPKLIKNIFLGRYDTIVDMEVVKDSLYIATETTVEKRTDGGNCSSFMNCSSCMNSNITRCGWCAFENKCTEGGSESCSRLWLPSLRNKCLLDLQLRRPAKEDVNTDGSIQPEVMLPANVNLTGLILRCEIKNVHSQLPLVTSDSGYRKCDRGLLIKNITDLKEGFIPLVVSATTETNTRSRNANFTPIASIDIYFFNCSNYHTCYECRADEDAACKWNYREGKCKKSGSDKDVANNVIECPQIRGGTVEKLRSGSTENLTFSGTNLFDVNTYKCVIEGVEYNATTVKTNDSLTCHNVKTDISNEPTKFVNFTKIVNFTQIVNGIKIPMETLIGQELSVAKVEVYKCEGLLTSLGNPNSLGDCSSCRYFGSNGYNCGWCNDGSRCRSGCNDTCGAPRVFAIKPGHGPIGGGTIVTITGINLGHTPEEVNVTIGGIPCTNLTFTRQRRLTCETGKASKAGSHEVTVKVNMENVKNLSYEYVEPSLTEFCKRHRSIRSGGGQLCIRGERLSTGNQHITVQMISQNGNVKKECNNARFSKPSNLSCEIPEVEKREIGLYNVSVTFDRGTVLTLSGFQYVDDPNITIPTELVSIISGGVKQEIKAEASFDFAIITTMFIQVGSSVGPCNVSGSKDIERNVISCTYPEYALSQRRRRKREAAKELPVQLYLDGLRTYLNNVKYLKDPEFLERQEVFQYDPGTDMLLELEGNDLTLVVSDPNFYLVTIGLGICTVKTLTNTTLTCKPPPSEPDPVNDGEKLTIQVKYASRVFSVGYAEYKAELQLTMIIIIALSASIVIITFLTIVIIIRVRRKSKREIDMLMTEIQALEEKTREEGKEEFATMQLTITDIKADLVSVGIPYHDYETFILNVLFPTGEQATFKEALSKDVVLSPNAKSAMNRFEVLLRNKFFMKSLIQTLERQKRITMQDKAQFSSLLSIVMIGRMKDFFDIVHCLVSTLVDTTPKKQHKVLFNRFENISLRLLINWLNIALYPSFKDNGGGTSLFMLYKAIMTVVEKRPVDDITGDAKNTLSHDRFLSCKVDFKIMTITIDLNGDGHEFTCEVLDCDTISQVKQKCLRQIYKNRPASQMPSIDEVTLEWRMGQSGKLPLSDFDHTSVREGEKIRKNTLKHYNVKDKSRMELRYKFSPAAPGSGEEDLYENTGPASPADVTIEMPTAVTEESLERLQKWHLAEAQTPDEDAVMFESKSGKVHLTGEKGMHITSLMHTKLILQEYIKAFFGQILDNNIPTVVHYLFNVLDNLAKSKTVEQDTLQCWKSESYAIRIWATLMARPDILFDVDRPKHIEPCLNSIRTLLIDCFHSTKITKDSSLQKLLFATEVPDYQSKVDIFYKILSQAASIGEDQFVNEMTKLSNVQNSTLKFQKLPALQKLYKFIQAYMDDILDDLEEDDETKDLALRGKLEDIIENLDKDE